MSREQSEMYILQCDDDEGESQGSPGTITIRVCVQLECVCIFLNEIKKKLKYSQQLFPYVRVLRWVWLAHDSSLCPLPCVSKCTAKAEGRGWCMPSVCAMVEHLYRSMFTRFNKISYFMQANQLEVKYLQSVAISKGQEK